MLEIIIHDDGKSEIHRNGTARQIINNYFSLQGTIGFLKNDIKEELAKMIKDENLDISDEAIQELVDLYWKDLENRVETLVIDGEKIEDERKWNL